MIISVVIARMVPESSVKTALQALLRPGDKVLYSACHHNGVWPWLKEQGIECEHVKLYYSGECAPTGSYTSRYDRMFKRSTFVLLFWITTSPLITSAFKHAKELGKRVILYRDRKF